MSGKDQISDDGAVELDEDALAEAQGGIKYGDITLKWKIGAVADEGNDVGVEEITIAHEYIKR